MQFYGLVLRERAAEAVRKTLELDAKLHIFPSLSAK